MRLQARALTCEVDIIGVLNEEQNGFRPDRYCQDHMRIVLTAQKALTVINHIVQELQGISV